MASLSTCHLELVVWEPVVTTSDINRAFGICFKAQLKTNFFNKIFCTAPRATNVGVAPYKIED